MNASDIVKAKQNRTLYKAYYRPTVFNSTCFSTISPVSTISEISSNVIIEQYSSLTSCVTCVNEYVCNPIINSYQFANSLLDGSYLCGKKKRSELEWKKTNSTLIYFYSTIMITNIVSTQINKFCSTPLISTITGNTLPISTLGNPLNGSTIVGSSISSANYLSTIQQVNYISTAVLVCDWTYTSTITPSSLYITSTTIMIAPQPLICPLINMQQGTSFLNKCNTCNTILTNEGYCCEQCQ